jgi:hypothetical protein
MSNAIAIARHYSLEIRNKRNLQTAFKSLVSETVELETEINNGSTGVDGIKGEVIDVLNSALDILFLAHPEITMDEIDSIMEAKCRKWMVKYAVDDEQTSTEGMREAGEIILDLQANSVPVEVIAKIANIEPNSVYRVIDGSLAARRTQVRLNGIYPIIKRAVGSAYRPMGPIWDKMGPDGVSLHDLIGAPVVDLAKLSACIDALAVETKNRREATFEMATGAELNAADGP